MSKNKKKKKETKEKKVGRPTKYKPEFCKMMVNWFDRELTQFKNAEKISMGEVITVKEEVANTPPMFGQFARKVAKVRHETMIKWCEQYPEFHKAYKECKNIQKEWIIMGCLTGYLNSSFGRFTLKNISDWRDNVETHISTDKGGIKLAYSLGQKVNDDSSSN